MKDNKKMSFISDVKNCICDFEKYPEMASRPLRTVLKYLIKLLAIFTIIVTVIALYKTTKNINNGVEYFKNDIPDVSFVDNNLKVDSEQAIKIENENNIVDLLIIDTRDISQEEIDKYTKEIGGYSTSAILLKDKILINIGTGTTQYSYEKLAQTYNVQDMTKQDMLNYFTGTNLSMLYIGIFIMSFIYLFIEYFVSTLLDILILGSIGYVTSLILRLRIRFAAIIKIATYSLTLPILLNLLYITINTLFGFQIEYFQIMYVAVAYIYIVTAIMMIKADLIKRGQEVAKIIEEQQRVKEQLEKEKEEEKQKKEEEKKQKEKEKKDKKKNEKQGSDVGEEPQGENA